MIVTLEMTEYLLSKLGVTPENIVMEGGTEDDYTDILMDLWHSANSYNEGLFVFNDRVYMVLNFTDDTYKAIEVILNT